MSSPPQFETFSTTRPPPPHPSIHNTTHRFSSYQPTVSILLSLTHTTPTTNPNRETQTLSPPLHLRNLFPPHRPHSRSIHAPNSRSSSSRAGRIQRRQHDGLLPHHQSLQTPHRAIPLHRPNLDVALCLYLSPLLRAVQTPHHGPPSRRPSSRRLPTNLPKHRDGRNSNDNLDRGRDSRVAGKSVV